MEWLLKILTACVPVLVALVGIIPTVIANRKKTQDSIKESNESTKKELENVKKELENVKNEVSNVQSSLTAHIREDEDEKARNQRYRILRFYDELCENRRHSESHFEDILDDIDEYEKYCEAHNDFKNNRGKVAMEYIKPTYNKVKSSGGFLVHE